MAGTVGFMEGAVGAIWAGVEAPMSPLSDIGDMYVLDRFPPALPHLHAVFGSVAGVSRRISPDVCRFLRGGLSPMVAGRFFALVSGELLSSGGEFGS